MGIEKTSVTYRGDIEKVWFRLTFKQAINW